MLQSTLLLQSISVINPFSTNVSLLYALKTSENLRFSDVFRRYIRGTWVENELRIKPPFRELLFSRASARRSLNIVE